MQRVSRLRGAAQERDRKTQRDKDRERQRERDRERQRRTAHGGRGHHRLCRHTAVANPPADRERQSGTEREAERGAQGE